jgi:hypothetical protein
VRVDYLREWVVRADLERTLVAPHPCGAPAAGLLALDILSKPVLSEVEGFVVPSPLEIGSNHPLAQVIIRM